MGRMDGMGSVGEDRMGRMDGMGECWGRQDGQDEQDGE